MKSGFTLLIVLGFFSLFVQPAASQTYVNTEPANKNVILEEFTGVRCPNCPQGHQVAQQIMENNPGRVWVIGFHPFNSSFTEPYPNNPDLRRHHPDALYTIPYCGSSRFMPSAFINRRVYGGERIQSRTVWEAKTNEHLAEPSPVNAGLATNYDDVSQELEMVVEIYYTSTVTDLTTLNVALLESGIVAQQSGGGTNYVHKHVFRETFTAQWGDPITEATTQGSFIQKTFTFDNAQMAYDMTKCEVIAYIVNDDTEEVLSGIGVHVGEYTVFEAPSPDFEVDDVYVAVGNSALFSDLSTGVIDTWEWTFEGGDPPTYNGPEPPAIIYNDPGSYSVSLTVTNIIGSNTETKTEYIHVDHAPVAQFSYDSQQFPSYTELHFTDMSTGSPSAWNWEFEGGDPATSAEQNPVVTYQTPGTYNVTLTVTSPYGESTLTEPVTVEIISGIGESAKEFFNIYPNPSNGIIYLSSGQNFRPGKVVVYDIHGAEVYRSETFTVNPGSIDLSALGEGIYFIAAGQENEIFTKKISIVK